MPYKSLAQERFFNANRQKLEAEGVNVDEFNRASKGKHLPQTGHVKNAGHESNDPARKPRK